MAGQPLTQLCGNCRYFQFRAWYYNPDGSINYSHRQNVCKRYSPDRLQHSNHRDAEGYPTVDGRQWCGEWAPANPETVSDGCVVLARLVLLGDLTAARALADKLKEE